MYKTVLLTTLCILCSSSNANALARKNTKSAKPNEFPFVVSISRAAGSIRVCGGALVSQRHVLTSERCVHDKRARDLRVSIGSDESSGHYNVASIMRFDDWTKRRNSVIYPDNDLAILSLETAVTDVEPGLIHERSRNVALYGNNVVTARWDEDGDVEGRLTKTFLIILTSDQCNENLYRLTRNRHEINEKYLCSMAVTRASTSKIDEGSPILYNDMIIGVNDGTFSDFIRDQYIEQNIHIGIEHYKRFILDILGSD